MSDTTTSASSTPPTRKTVRVAVIGTGLAGLTSAYLLSEQAGGGQDEADYDVHLFEKSGRIGLDAASIEVQGNDGKRYRVDSPMRAVQGGYYDHLLQLYRRLGIRLQPSNFTYSFLALPGAREKAESALPENGLSPPSGQSRSRQSTSQPNEKTTDSNAQTTFIYNGNNGLSFKPVSFPASESTGKGTSPSATFMQLYQAVFFALSYAYLLLISVYHYYFSHLEPASSHWVAHATFKDFLSHYRLPNAFCRSVLIPLFSCVATCSIDELLEYPAAELLQYIVKTFGTDHYVVKNGVRDVVDALLKKIPRDTNVHLDCELVSMKKPLLEDGLVEVEDSQGNIYTFDHVIFATQANQARYLLRTYYKSLLDAPERDEAAITLQQERLAALSHFSYTSSIVVNHHDGDAVLSQAVEDRRSLNLAISPVTEERAYPLDGKKTADHSKMVSPASQYIMATHDLSFHNASLVHPKTGEAVLQTTNPTVPISDDKIISKSTFERAIVTMQSKRTLQDFLECRPTQGNKYQGKGNVWFVGAWAAEGIPLLEGCVTSSERVTEAIRLS